MRLAKSRTNMNPFIQAGKRRGTNANAVERSAWFGRIVTSGNTDHRRHNVGSAVGCGQLTDN